METLRQDLKYAVRMFGSSPGFTVIAVLTLAFGIGANTAIFSIIDSVLRRPVATPEVERLVVVRRDLPQLDLRNTELAPADIPDLAARTDLFQSFGGYRPVDWNLTGSGEPVRMAGAITLGDFFETFRVRPHLGRLYTAESSTSGAHEIVVLSYAAWQQLTGGDPEIIGRTIQLDGQAREVAGVLPPEFRYPRNTHIYKPFNFTPQWQQNRGSLVMLGIGRLQPGVTHAQLAHQLEIQATRWNEQLTTGLQQVVYAIPFAEYLAGTLRLVLMVLLGAVVLVLLIACVNVGSLQLVRAAGRSREIAVRTALGSGRGRIVRQLLVESTVLALAGGALGLWLGAIILDLLARWDPAQQQALDNVRLDGSVLAFTAVLSILTAVAFGTFPALRAARIEPQSVLREATRGAAGSPGRTRLLHAGVVVQVALAVVLLLGSGLVIRSLAQLLETDTGLSPDRLVTAQVSLPGSTYGTIPLQVAFYDAVLERLRAAPGVESATVGWALPFSDQIRDSSPFDVIGRPARPGEPRRHAEYRVVDADYFRTMGIPLLRGRPFAPSDGLESPSGRVVLIDEHFASQFFPNEDPIGREIQHARGQARIVGVVGTVDHGEIGEPRKALSYYHFRQTWSASMAIAVRTSLDLTDAATLVRSAVRQVDPDLPLYDVATMEQRIQRSLGERRLAMVALGAFAGLSLLLAMLGVYGVMRYSTNQRTQEIGIRIALGASPGELVGMIVRQGMVMVAAGILIGVGAGLVLTRLMEGILFGVSARDPLTFAAVTVLLVAVALLATLLPASHAARVEPVVALRAE